MLHWQDFKVLWNVISEMSEIESEYSSALEIQMDLPAHSCIVWQVLKKEGIIKYIRVRSKLAMASDNNAIYKMSWSQVTPLFCDCLYCRTHPEKGKSAQAHVEFVSVWVSVQRVWPLMAVTSHDQQVFLSVLQPISAHGYARQALLIRVSMREKCKDTLKVFLS